jgi:hypothetical protein
MPQVLRHGGRAGDAGSAITALTRAAMLFGCVVSWYASAVAGSDKSSGTYAGDYSGGTRSLNHARGGLAGARCLSGCAAFGQSHAVLVRGIGRPLRGRHAGDRHDRAQRQDLRGQLPHAATLIIRSWTARFRTARQEGQRLMSLFKCQKCGCGEDTALCHYWSARLRETVHAVADHDALTRPQRFRGAFIEA